MDETLVCQTCLSCDRVLSPLKNLEPLLKNINISLNKCNLNDGVCWECKAIIMKFSKFKTQVLEAQKLLTYNNLKNNLFSNLKTYTKCIYDYIYNYDDTNINDIKVKIKPIKEDITDNFDSEDDNNFNNESINEEYSNCSTDNPINNNINENNEINSIKIKITKTQNEILKTKICLKKSKAKHKIIKNKTKEIDNREIKDKIETITFTEEEMLRNRTQKRNQPNFIKIPYKCDSCVLGFTRKETYQLHKEKKHHESIGPLTCNVCSIRFTSSVALSRHRQRHYTIYRCTLCKYEASLLKAAINHCLLKHDKDKRGLIHCGQCSVTVETAEDLTEHINKNHMLICNHCGEKFKGKHTLRTHKIRIHSSNRAFTCDVCKRTFNTKSRLESHITSHNNLLAKKLAYCSICKVQYKNIYVYRNHLKNSANHSERQYHCKDCNKKFASKVYWQKHCDFYHLHKSAFKCDICDKLFMSDWRLKNHKQKHHGLSRSRNHTCNVCGKMFYTQSTLRAHQLTHSEERSYMCEDCGDTFKQRPALYTHTKLVHKGVKRIKQN